MAKKHPVGGQAVVEGIMIKGPKGISVAVRSSDGKIVDKVDPLPKKTLFSSIMFIRGVYNLIEQLVYGMRALIWSSNQVLGESEDDEELSKGEVALLLLTSFAFAIIFFVALPYFLTYIMGLDETVNPVLFNLVDGVVKITIFFLYLVVISLMKDIRRIFQYHGAEHKAIYCYENDKELTVKNVKAYSTLHPRCGTSFLMYVLFVSVFVFALLPSAAYALFPEFSALNPWAQKGILFPLRILFIPVIAGISYEILKLAAKYDNPIFSLLSLPGLAVQKITTKEPDDKQIEVAIHAIKKVI